MSLYAMQRANGDWYALDDKGSFGVPVFQSRSQAMVARSRDSGMECFRPVMLDQTAYLDLTTTSEGQAHFWLIGDPLVKLNCGRSLDHAQLAMLMRNGNEQSRDNKVTK